jgi:hypothetical protein
MYRSVRLASSLAAALLDGLFEQPAGLFSWCATYYELSKPNRLKQFFRILYETGAAAVQAFTVKNTVFPQRNHPALSVGVKRKT